MSIYGNNIFNTVNESFFSKKKNNKSLDSTIKKIKVYNKDLDADTKCSYDSDKYTEEEVKEYVENLFKKINFKKEIEKNFCKYLKDNFNNVARNKVELNIDGGGELEYTKGSVEFNFNYIDYSMKYNEEKEIYGQGDDLWEEGWYIYFTIHGNSISKVVYNFVD